MHFSTVRALKRLFHVISPITRILSICINRTVLAGVLVAGAALGGAKADPVNLVQNGSFEDTVGFDPSQSGSEVTNSNLTDWQISGCLSGCTNGAAQYSFLLQSNYTTNGFYIAEYNENDHFYGGGPGVSPSGGNAYAADGGYQVGGLGQMIKGLTIGQTYQLSFYQASAEQSGYPGAFTASWLVGFGNQTQQSSGMVTASQSYSGWVQDTMDFTATAVDQVLWFMATSTNSYPPFLLLDGVSLTQVPEPATFGVVAVGLAGLVAVRRRRRVTQA